MWSFIYLSVYFSVSLAPQFQLWLQWHIRYVQYNRMRAIVSVKIIHWFLSLFGLRFYYTFNGINFSFYYLLSLTRMIQKHRHKNAFFLLLLLLRFYFLCSNRPTILFIECKQTVQIAASWARIKQLHRICQ